MQNIKNIFIKIYNNILTLLPLKSLVTVNNSPSTPIFQLKTKKINIHLIPILIAFIILFGIIFFNTSVTLGSNKISLGDSALTEMIVQKESTQTLNHKPITTKEELQSISNTAPLSFAFYRILPGENLSSVATKFGLSMATVLSLNSLDNAHSLSVGQKILIPTRSGIIFNTTNKESVSDIAERYGISAEQTSLVNALAQDEIQEGTTLFLPDANLSFKAMAEILGYQFINPVPGYRRISSHFGWRRHPILKKRILHRGIDFAARIGTPIYAPKEGRVVSSGWSGSFGLTIVIRHNNGLTTLYAHQSELFVKSGQWVTTGQRIGSVGNTGRSTGPHLHFEVRKYGQARNPVYNGLQI